jgi:hypothetical protein
MIGFLTLSIFTTKFMDEFVISNELNKETNQYEKYTFFHPFFQAALMNLGELFSLVIYFIKYAYSKIKEYSDNN